MHAAHTRMHERLHREARTSYADSSSRDGCSMHFGGQAIVTAHSARLPSSTACATNSQKK